MQLWRRRHSATFTTVNGVPLPAGYGEPDAEYGGCESPRRCSI